MTQNFGDQLKFYNLHLKEVSKRTAVDFQYVESQGTEKYMTMNVSVAPYPTESKTVDWEQKITVQLTRSELTAFCGVLFATEKEVKGRFHGDNHNKGFTAISNDAAGCVITVSEHGKQLTFIIDHARRIELGAFVLRRQAMAWKVTVSDVLAIIRQAASIKRQ